MQIVHHLADPSMPLRICASVSIPRIGFDILLARPDESVLFGTLAGCNASLDASSCCTFSIKTAEIGTRAVVRHGVSSDDHAQGSHLLRSPCLSFAQLQQKPRSHPLPGRVTPMPASMQVQMFVTGTFTPSGVGRHEIDDEPPCAPFDTVPAPFKGRLTLDGAAPLGSSFAAEIQPERDYVPSPSGSVLSQHEMPIMHEELQRSQRHRQARATELLAERIKKLRGDVLFGIVSATIAPLEVFIDSAALVRILELGTQLWSDVTQGDVFLQQCASTTTTNLAKPCCLIELCARS